MRIFKAPKGADGGFLKPRAGSKNRLEENPPFKGRMSTLDVDDWDGLTGDAFGAAVRERSRMAHLNNGASPFAGDTWPARDRDDTRSSTHWPYAPFEMVAYWLLTNVDVNGKWLSQRG